MGDFEPRRADPGQVFETQDGDGKTIRLKADKDGVVQPSNIDEVRLADAFHLPVARKVLAEQKAAGGEG